MVRDPPPVTVSDADPETLPDVAVIDAVPALIAVANPCEPAALLTVATPVLDELQVAEAVKSCVEPFEYVPVAVNCWVPPVAIDGLAGVTAIDTRVAVVTVSAVEPEMLPSVARIVVDPAATDAAKPFVPAELLIVAIPVLEELQVTEVVTFCVDPFE